MSCGGKWPCTSVKRDSMRRRKTRDCKSWCVNMQKSRRAIQHLLKVIQGHAETIERPPEPWPYRRQYAFPLGSSDSSLFRELAGSIDFVHHQVPRVFFMNEADTDVTLFPSAKDAHPRLFADKILPYSVELTGDAAWQFFASGQPLGFIIMQNRHRRLDLCAMKKLGEEHHFSKVPLDFKVKQIVRRYMVAGRVVIAWRAILSPKRFKAESLSGIQFEEKGALVIEPYQVAHQSGGHETASVVHTWQMITPDIILE